MERCRYRFGTESDLPMLRQELDHGAWSHLSRLLKFSCTKADWIILGFEAGILAGALALAAPSRFNLPLEVIRLHGTLDGRIDHFSFFQLALEQAKTFGVRELYCTIPENSAEASLLAHARFCQWRTVVRFESEVPGDSRVRGYRSVEAGHLDRAELIALIEKSSENGFDSQIEYYRQRLGGMADAELTLRMMESTDFDPCWWRTALAPDGKLVGIIFPVIAFGESTIGFIGVVPEHRGRNIASFLIAEAWSIMEPLGHLTLCAETDARSVSMQRTLTKSSFSRRWQRQEWRLEF